MSDYESIASDGSIVVDHVWLRQLQRALDETECPASLEDALRPLTARFPDEIDAGDLQAAVHGQREIWRDVLYSAAGGFDMPRSYLLDWAVAIYVYTLADPKVFKIVNREMFNSDRRKPGMSGGVSDGLRACLPYIRFLVHALKALPEKYVFRGEVRRGVKHAYPSPEDHDPVRHFSVGKRLAWYEFKSTSKKAAVMTRDHFCGVDAGPRTTFIIDVICGYDISMFSFFQGTESEYEVLLLPMSQFEVVSVVKNIIDPKETVCIRRSGFPDTVHLRQVDSGHAPAAAGGRTAQEQADTALARALQELDCQGSTAQAHQPGMMDQGMQQQMHQAMLMQHRMQQANAGGQRGHHGTDYGHATMQQANAPPMSGQQIPDTGREGVQGLWFFECVHPTPAPAPRRRRVATRLRACALRAFA